MKKTLTALMVAFTLLVASVGVSFAQDYKKGEKAYVQGDFATAVREWWPLAEQGNVFAQFNMGLMYDIGQGVPQDYKEAVKWYRKSAEQGHVAAQSNLGRMYRDGQGVAQHYKEAVKWFRKSAEQGNPSAQSWLDSMYADGLGVTQDNIYAHMWLNVSASAGFEHAIKGRDIIASRMTASQIAAAQSLARECVRKNYKGC